MLSRSIKYGFSFNILNAFKGIRDMVKAPFKHIKAITEPSGLYYSTKTNTTQQAFDEVSHEWQAYVGNNPFDMQTYNYLENVQLSNFGTVDNPLVIFTADAPFRYVGCSGPQNEDDYESHQLIWMMIRQGPLQRCAVCGQVFKLVRLRNQFSSEMDYYLPNFNKLWIQDMGEHDVTNNLSITKANTHFQTTLFQTPENDVYGFVTSDEHDRMLVDPAFRIQKQMQGENRAQMYDQAMEDYQNEKFLKSNNREPINKVVYENLIEAEALIKKLDRQFRKVTKFHSRKYVDPINHERRQKRMLERSKKRWDSAYTLYTGNLTEEQQKYRDYFETDLQNYREDERLEEFLDKQELLIDPKYNLNKYDFQEGYTYAPEDDQTSYIEKKIFKFKYRRALDTAEQYQLRNSRMIERQKQRFEKNQVATLISNYLANPAKYEAEYLKFVAEQSVAQYRDYFEEEKDELQQQVLSNSKDSFCVAFENWQIPKQDRSTFKTLPLPEWNNQLGYWANAITLLKQINDIPTKIPQIQAKNTTQSLSSSSLTTK